MKNWNVSELLYKKKCLKKQGYLKSGYEAKKQHKEEIKRYFYM